MASNSTDMVQSRSSQPPANTMSCLPHWIVSAALPMQWFDVAEADGGVFVGTGKAGLRLAQARQPLLRVVADGRNDAHSGDDHPPHGSLVRTENPALVPPI